MRHDLPNLLECAQYIIDSEGDDFFQYVLDETNDPLSQIYATAYIALYGRDLFEIHLAEIRSDDSNEEY
jgi:hypothetical protein